jgi:hypothetical protein
LEKLIGMSERYLKEREDLGLEAGKEHMVRCQACDKSRNQEELSRCRGCEAVWYCDKVACNPSLSHVGELIRLTIGMPDEGLE